MKGTRVIHGAAAWISLLLACHATAQIQPAWTRNYSGNFSGYIGGFSYEALDGQGNICLTGTAIQDFFTVKYSPDGSLIWSNRFDGGSAETAQTLASDGQGQVWISGLSQFTNGTSQTSALLIKYNAAGELAWTQRFHNDVLSSVVKLDGSGNCYLAGALGGGRLYVAKYSAGGSQLWARTYLSMPGWYMNFGGMALDGSGSVALTGLATELTTFGRRNVLVKYDAAGNLLWSNETLPYVGGGTPSTMAMDPEGNVFVSGNGLLAAKLDLNGTLQWTRIRSGARPGFTFSNVEIDPAGNLVIGGTDALFHKLCSDCGDSETIYYLIHTKLDRNGNILEPERSYKDFGFGYMQFDADGSCYVGGSYSTYSDDSLPPHPDSILLKFAPNGAELWQTNFSTGFMAGVNVNGAGDIYLINGIFNSIGIRRFVQPQTAPAIRTQPSNRTVLHGSDATFNVSGSGFPSPTFQWHFNGTTLPKETNDTLTLTAVNANQAGNYTVVLSNSLGSVSSTPATLTVNLAAPTVTAQFTFGGTQALAGSSVIMCAQATGGPKPGLQWRFNGVELPGQTNACLTLGPLQISQSGTYSVVASNAVSTASASLNLNVAPVIIYYYGSTSSVAVGSCLYLSSDVGVASPYSLQWTLNGTALPDQDGPWLTWCLTDINEAGLYALVVRNNSGSYTSAPVQISTYYAPPRDAYPQVILGDPDAFAGEDLGFSASHTGSPSSIQWLFNGVNLPGETNHTLSLLAITTSQAGDYSFVASNIVGATTSSVRTVTVSYQAPVFGAHPGNLSVVEGTAARVAAYARGGPPPVYSLERNGTNVAVPFAYQLNVFPPGGFTLFDVTFADAGDYRIIASNSFGTATSFVATLTVTAAGPLDRWTQRNPLPQSQSILSVAHGPNQFVAVGERGTIMTSPDGANWTLRNRRADVALNGVVYGQQLFVAVGDAGTILSSSDGTNWAYRYTAASTLLSSVTHGAGRFVAVGTTPGLTTLLLTSTNAIDWERISFNGPSAQQCITYGNGLFVAGGSSSIIASSNGLDWSVALNVGRQIEGVTYANGRYVAVGDDGTVLVSTEGTSWTLRPAVTTRRLLGVTYGAGQFVAAGARGNVITSTDALSWTPVTSGTPDRMETIDFFGGTFVSAGENGTMITSTNGSSWTKRNFGVTRDLDGMDVANGTLVVVGKGGTILTSRDGVNYTAQNAGLTNDLHGVTWGGGLWVAVGEPGVIVTSSNAVNWSSRPSGTISSLKDATYANGQWIAVGTEGTILRSTDGAIWTASYTSPSYDLNDVAYGNGMFLIAGDGLFDRNGSVFKSLDGLTWARANFNPTKNLRGVTFRDGLFLFTANDGHIVTTSNAVDFSSFDNHYENYRAATWAKGLWIAVGNDGTIATSPDTAYWTQRASRIFENLHQVAWLDGRFVAIGNRGTILQSGRLEALLDPPQYVSGAGLRFPYQGVLNRTYQIQASTNLVNWTNLLTFTNQTERGEFTDAEALQFQQRFYRLREE